MDGVERNNSRISIHLIQINTACHRIKEVYRIKEKIKKKSMRIETCRDKAWQALTGSLLPLGGFFDASAFSTFIPIPVVFLLLLPCGCLSFIHYLFFCSLFIFYFSCLTRLAGRFSTSISPSLRLRLCLCRRQRPHLNICSFLSIFCP